MMNGQGKSDRPVVADEVSEQRRPIGRGGDGGKGSGQREPATSKTRPGHRAGTACRVRWRGYVQAAERDKQVRFTALLHPIYNVEHLRCGVFRAEAGGRPGNRWRDVASTTGRTSRRTSQDLSGRLQRGAYRAKPVRRVYIAESRRAATAAGHSHAGRQNRPARDGRGAERDLRGRLSGLLVRIPTGAQPARCAGRALCRAPDAEGELGARCRHPGVFRRHRPRMAGEVHRAPDCGPARRAAHPEMAERGRAGGRAVDAEWRRERHRAGVHRRSWPTSTCTTCSTSGSSGGGRRRPTAT